MIIPSGCLSFCHKIEKSAVTLPYYAGAQKDKVDNK